VRDITERKRAAEAYRETEERYRSIVETSPDAITLTGLDRKIVICNQQAADLLGYDRADEMLGIDALELVAADDRKAAIEESQEAFRTGSLRNARYRLVKKDGTVFPGEVSASVIRDAAGTVAGYTAVLRDVTDRERTQDALRASEERFRVLYHDNPSMYFTVTADGAVLSVNEFGAAQLGYSPEELVGQPVLEVFFEGDKAEVAKQLAACVRRSGEMHHWEFRKVRKDGRVIWVRESARATKDASGETIILIVCEDITERRLMEEELQMAREALENKVERQMVRGRAYGLTFRELTVLHLVSAGSSDKEMAEKLGISPLTVSKHVSNVLTKMGAATRSEASARAVRESIVE
jgi:PAS domain S-box-containing protein